MSYKYLSKNGPLIAFIGAVVFMVIVLIPLFSGLSDFESLPDNNQRAYAQEGNIFYIGIYVTIILLIAAVAAAILLSLLQVATNPKGAMKGLLAFGIIVVLFLVLYSISDGSATGSLGETIERFAVSNSISKLISAGIALTLMMGIGSVVIIVLLEFWNYFKNQ